MALDILTGRLTPLGGHGLGAPAKNWCSQAISRCQDDMAQALRKYGVAERPTFHHPSCSFSDGNLQQACDEMACHLGVSSKADGAQRRVQLPAGWCYANNAQEVAMLSYLIPDVECESLYIGVTVHLLSSADSPDQASLLHLDESVSNDVAATCAAIELLMRALRGQPRLKYVRLDLNVLATTCSPFEAPACRLLLGNDAVGHSLELMAGALRGLLDNNTGIKTFKLGLHQRLYELFGAAGIGHAQHREEQRAALLLAKHDRAGARSALADVPLELVQQIVELALPTDQSVEVLALRK